MMKFFLEWFVLGLEKKNKGQLSDNRSKNRQEKKPEGHKIASKRRKRKRGEDKREDDGEEGEDEKEKKGKIDGKALAANATLAFSGLVGENFHHRLFFAAISAKMYKSCDHKASGTKRRYWGRLLSVRHLWHQHCLSEEPDQLYWFINYKFLI